MKNKAFLLISVVIVGLVFAFAAYFNKPAEPVEEIKRANPALLIREHTYIKGSAQAPVTIVEFFDPECEACRAMHPVLNRLLNEYAGKVRIAYRHTPFHGNSVYASALLEEARGAGKFEEAMDLFFEKLPEWGDHHNPQPEKLVGYMKQLGLDAGNKDQVIAKHKAKIELDERDGRELIVQGTPTFFVNGRRLFSIGYEPLKMAIEEELKAQR